MLYYFTTRSFQCRRFYRTRLLKIVLFRTYWYFLYCAWYDNFLYLFDWQSTFRYFLLVSLAAHTLHFWQINIVWLDNFVYFDFRDGKTADVDFASLGRDFGCSFVRFRLFCVLLSLNVCMWPELLFEYETFFNYGELMIVKLTCWVAVRKSWVSSKTQTASSLLLWPELSINGSQSIFW